LVRVRKWEYIKDLNHLILTALYTIDFSKNKHMFNLSRVNSPPLWGVKLGVRGICSPTYSKISRWNLQYPAALPRGFFIRFPTVGADICSTIPNSTALVPKSRKVHRL
jgi:hypothetical protein